MPLRASGMEWPGSGWRRGVRCEEKLAASFVAVDAKGVCLAFRMCGFWTSASSASELRGNPYAQSYFLKMHFLPKVSRSIGRPSTPTV